MRDRLIRRLCGSYDIGELFLRELYGPYYVYGGRDQKSVVKTLRMKNEIKKKKRDFFHRGGVKGRMKGVF